MVRGIERTTIYPAAPVMCSRSLATWGPADKSPFVVRMTGSQ
jgi:hypothetical protein